MKNLPKLTYLFVFLLLAVGANAQAKPDEKAETVVKRAVENLGGDKYLQVKSQIGRGKYYLLRGGATISYQTFVDVLVYPNKERTEFKFGGVKNIQTNSGEGGWVYDGAASTVN